MTTQQITSYYANLILLQYGPASTGPQTIYTQADVSGSLAGTYMAIYDGGPGIGYVLWNKVSGIGGPPVFPNSNGTQIPQYIDYEVSFPQNSSAAFIAAAYQAVIATIPNFSGSTVSGNAVTLINATSGPYAACLDINTGFTFSKTNAVSTIETSVTPVIANQLPTTLQNAFQIGTNPANPNNPPAVGNQLDILAKYVGVSRTGVGIYQQPITLNDADFTQLIIIGIATNNFGSSLSDIDTFLFTFFPNEIFVYDGEDMELSYLMTSSIGSQNFVQMIITQGLLPKPMGVSLASVVYVATLGLFGFLDYDNYTIVAGSPVLNIPTWSSSVSYSIGNRVIDSNGQIIYQSVTNSNLNNALTNINFWTAIIYPTTDYNGYTTYTQTPAYTGNWHWLDYSDTITIPT